MCLVVHALVHPQNGKVPTLLLNPKTEEVLITNHIQISTIELVNVNLGVVVNNFAAPVQSDHKLDECLWHNVEESGAELSE